MRIFISLSVAFLFIATLAAHFDTSSAQGCANFIRCQNNGTFSNLTCVCSCFPTYSGSACENLNCLISDPNQCRGFGLSTCSVPLIRNYCPNKCGLCPASAITTATTTATTLTTTTATTATTTTTFATTTCSAATNRAFCVDIPEAAIATACSDSIFAAACPVSCGGATCQNFGTFNSATCSCNCLTPWSGKACDTVDCTKTDPAACTAITVATDCTSQSTRSLCPITCGVACGRRAFLGY